MKNKKDSVIWMSFSEEEIKAMNLKTYPDKRLEIAPEMKAYIKQTIQYMYTLCDEEERENMDRILKNIRSLQNNDETDTLQKTTTNSGNSRIGEFR